MKKLATLAAIGLLASPCLADGNVSSNKHFSAEVVNIRRAATGKTLVTVLFTAKVEDDITVTLYSATASCRDSATLIDADGNEYGTNRCMENKGYYNRPGLSMQGGYNSQFVYEFTTPKSNADTQSNNINLIIPIIYTYCGDFAIRNSNNGRADRSTYFECKDNATTVSFYNLSVK